MEKSKTRIRFSRGVFEVYYEGKFMSSFPLKEEAQLYAQIVGRDLNWELVRSLLREKVEKEFGACEIFSLRVEFPYLCLNMIAKGVEVQKPIRIGRGWFSDERRLVNCILPHVGEKLGVPFSPVYKEEVARVVARMKREESPSLFEG